MLFEVIDAFHHLAGFSEEAEVLAFAFQRLAVQTLKLGFVVEGVDMTYPATAKDLNDAFRPGPKIRLPGGGCALGLLAAHEPRERDAAETASRVGKKMAARKQRANARMRES